MRFSIMPDGDGFAVVVFDTEGNSSMSVAGFPTHESAQGYIQDLTLKLLRSLAQNPIKKVS